MLNRHARERAYFDQYHAETLNWLQKRKSMEPPMQLHYDAVQNAMWDLQVRCENARSDEERNAYNVLKVFLVCWLAYLDGEITEEALHELLAERKEAMRR